LGYFSTEDKETVEAVEKIPALAQRKVVALIPAALSGTEPPSLTTITDVATDKSA